MPIDHATSTGNQWERRYGYSRAVRSANLILTTGTVAIKDNKPFAPGDPYAQTLRCLEIIAAALADLGANKTDILRTRFYVTDISRADDFGMAHAAFFGDHRPALTMVEVARLIGPEFLIEIEAEAATAAPPPSRR